MLPAYIQMRNKWNAVLPILYRSAVWQKYEQDTGAFLPKSECQIGKNMGKI